MKYSAPRFAIAVPLILLVLTAGDAAESLPKRDQPVRALGLSRDGRYLAIAWSREVQFWDLKEGRCLHLKTSDQFEYQAVAVKPDGACYLYGNDDRTIGGWSDRKEWPVLSAAAGISALAFSGDGKHFLHASRDGRLGIWNTASLEMERSIEAQLFGYTCLAVDPDGTRALTGAADQLASLWDLDSGTRITRLEGGVRGIKAHLGMIRDVAFVPGTGEALTAAMQPGDETLARKHVQIKGDDSIRMWDLPSGKPTHSIYLRSGACLVETCNRHRVAFFVQSYNRSLWGPLYRLDLGRWQYEMEFKEPDAAEPMAGVSALVLSHDEAWAVLGTANGRLFFYDLLSRKPFGMLLAEGKRWTFDNLKGARENSEGGGPGSGLLAEAFAGRRSEGGK